MSTASNWSAEFSTFWTERRLATLTTLRPDGSPHVVPVGVTLDFDTSIARVICSDTSRKARNVEQADGSARVAVCQFEGARWSTLEGTAVLRRDPAAVLDAELRYAQRYRVPRANPARVVIEFVVDRTLGLR
ncbi:TIGR03618 family F420-dependent PPOX class oxidoreductase [soil metagenome]